MFFNKQKKLDAQENTRQAMLNYLQEKYGETFTEVEWIPAKIKFNGMEESILVVRSPEGFLTNVRERTGSLGYFYDDFMDSYASFIAEDLIDFSNIPSLIIGKIYPNLRVKYITYDDLKNGISSLTEATVINILSFVVVSETPNDAMIDALYSVYQQLMSKGFHSPSLVVAVTKDTQTTTKYFENYTLHGITRLYDFDKSINTCVVFNGGLSFDEFNERFEFKGQRDVEWFW